MFDTAKIKVLVICGPTASGKSNYAEEQARARDGEIISADSMQIYKGMDIGTSKIPIEQRFVPYHCLDLLNPDEAYSAALFQRDARAAIEDITARGKLPIICGGTGLYIRAAIDDMSFPAGREVNSAVRQEYEKYLEQNGAEALHALLEKRDVESAELIHPNNTRRVIRALEMLDNDSNYAVQHSGFKTFESIYDVEIIGLRMNREKLYSLIDLRVDEMIKNGLIEETKKLLERGFKSALTAMQAIGYKEIIEYLEGVHDLKDAAELIKQKTRRYAKRQITWFSQDPRIKWMDVG